MIEKFIPDEYQKSVYTIDYKKLKKLGIKCLLFDLDNTLVPCSVDKPNKKVKDLFAELEEMGFKVILMSNSPRKRLAPFKEILNVDTAALSLKPRKVKYLKIMKEYKFASTEIAAIGDQIVTDIFGANRVGIRSILVNPISESEFAITSFNRFLEKRILNILHKKELFTKGEYYE